MRRLHFNNNNNDDDDDKNNNKSICKEQNLVPRDYSKRVHTQTHRGTRRKLN